MEGLGPKIPGPLLLMLIIPLTVSPPQFSSSAPKTTSIAPFEVTPPLIVEEHTNSAPPGLTRTPPDTFAPLMRHIAPALTTTPPTTVPERAAPEIGGLARGPVSQTVVASAWPPKPSSAKPTRPI